MHGTRHDTSATSTLSRRRFLAGLVAVASTSFASLLAACAPTPTAAPTAGSGQVQRQEAQTGSPAVKGETITVIMFPPHADAANALKGEFEQASGIKVNVLSEPYASLHDKLLTNFVGGTEAFDVVDVPAQWDGEFAQYLESIQPYLEKGAIDVKAFIPRVWEVTGVWGDHRFGIPIAAHSFTVFVRKDLLDQAGLAEPKTLDELVEAARGLQQSNVHGYVYGGSKVQTGSYWFSRFKTYGGSLFTPDWKPTVNNEAGVKATQNLKDLIAYSPPGVLNYGLPEYANDFLGGRAAFVEGWSQAFGAGLDDPAKSRIVGKWAALKYPGVPHLGQWDLAIPKTSKKKDAAFAFIEWFARPETAKKSTLQFGWTSAIESVWLDPEVVKKYPWHPTELEGLKIGDVRLRLPLSQQLVDKVQEHVHAFLSGSGAADAAAVAAAIQRDWEELIKTWTPTVPYED